MHVDVRQSGEVIIVDLEGDLVAGTGDEILREVVNELLAGGWKHVLMNLSQVPKIDSAGIGELVASIKLAERFGTSVRLLQVTGRVRDVLEFSQVLPLFHVYEDEDEAVAAFTASVDGAAAAASAND